MKYLIDDIIRRLTEAKKEGKVLISESELIEIATPKINHINEIVRLIDNGIEEIKKRKFLIFSVSLTDAANLTGISRQTFYRWEKKGIVKMVEYGCINLVELKGTILKIKEIHERHK
jgi:DNA invertase Pin-like site-specific DNA recombinase